MGVNVQRWNEQANSTVIADLSDSPTRLLKSLTQGKNMSTVVVTKRIAEASPRFNARMAGVSYLLGALTSVLGQMVVLGMLVEPGSATATAANILSHESLFRLGFVCSLMTVPFHLVWAVLFY